MVIASVGEKEYVEIAKMNKIDDEEEDIWVPLNSSPQRPVTIMSSPPADDDLKMAKMPMINRRDTKDNKDVDKGWAWVVLFSTFMTYFVMQGQSFTGNIYFVIYLNVFQESRSFTALVGSSSTAAACFIGPLTSYLLMRWGPRVITMLGGCLMALSFACIFTAQSMVEVIIYSAIRGAGMNFAICSCQASLSKYFSKRLYLATSVMYSASALGMTVVAIITEYSVQHFGWRGSLLIQSGLALQLVVVGSLVYRLPKEDEQPISIINEDLHMLDSKKRNGFRNNQKKSKKKKKSLPIKKYFTDVLFWLTGLSSTFLFIIITVVFQFWKDILPNKDLFNVAIISMAVGSTIGRLTAGLISRVFYPSLHNSVVTAVCAVAVMLFLVADRVWIVVVQSALWGFCNGQHIVTDRLQMTWVFGAKEVATVIGLTFALAGFGGVTMLPLAGYITDVTGNYVATLSLCAGILLMASINSITIFIIKRKRIKRAEQLSQVENTEKGTEMTTITENNKLISHSSSV